MKLIETIESKLEWPEHIVLEVNQVRAALQCEGLLDEPTLLISRPIAVAMDVLLRHTTTTYWQALRENNLCYPDEKEEIPEDEAHFISGDGIIVLKGIKIVTEKKCHYCDNTFPLNKHRDALSGDRLICASCYDHVFEAVLGG